jgi:hypothetical protein
MSKSIPLGAALRVESPLEIAPVRDLIHVYYMDLEYRRYLIIMRNL